MSSSFTSVHQTPNSSSLSSPTPLNRDDHKHHWCTLRRAPLQIVSPASVSFCLGAPLVACLSPEMKKGRRPARCSGSCKPYHQHVKTKAVKLMRGSQGVVPRAASRQEQHYLQSITKGLFTTSENHSMNQGYRALHSHQKQFENAAQQGVAYNQIESERFREIEKSVEANFNLQTKGACCPSSRSHFRNATERSPR